MKKLVQLLALLMCIALLVTACGGGEGAGESAKLSFADSASLDALKALDSKRVTITGYMATLSPPQRRVHLPDEHALPELPLLRAQHQPALQHHGGVCGKGHEV